uniref:Uncharacterized protein n=1 Tax=Rhizophora mucronata TaxID=61149 RepID=A0A2P2QYW9_RHIMU
MMFHCNCLIANLSVYFCSMDYLPSVLDNSG